MATPSPIQFGGNRPLQPGSPFSQACRNRGESPPEGTLPGPCQPMVFQCAFRSGGQVGHPMGHSLIRVSIPPSDGRSPSVDTVSSRQAREASCPPPCWPPAPPGARLAWGGVPTKEGNPSLWGSWGHQRAPSAAWPSPHPPTQPRVGKPSGLPLPGYTLFVESVLPLPWELSIGKCWVGWAGGQAGAGRRRTVGGGARPSHTAARPPCPLHSDLILYPQARTVPAVWHPPCPPSGQAVLSAPREFPDRLPHLAPGPLPLPPLLLRPPGGRGEGLWVLTPCSRICLLPKRGCLRRASQRLMAEDGEARGPERPWSRLRAASGPSQGHLGPGSGAEPGSSWAGTVTATRWDSEMASPPWWQPGLARWPSSHTESSPDLQAASHPSLPTRQKLVANHGCGHRHSQDQSSRPPLGSGTGYVLFQDVPSPCAFELVLPGHPFLRPHLP